MPVRTRRNRRATRAEFNVTPEIREAFRAYIESDPPGGGFHPWPEHWRLHDLLDQAGALALGVLGLGFLVVLTVLAWFAATRRGPGSPALATVHPGDEPDYSTDLDLETLASLRRPLAARAEPARAVRDRGTLARTLESVTGAASAVARLFRRK